jgi:hypothetical protein
MTGNPHERRHDALTQAVPPRAWPMTMREQPFDYSRKWGCSELAAGLESTPTAAIEGPL